MTLALEKTGHDGPWIGHPMARVDGKAKVTGDARYAAEFHAPGLLHGVVVSSSIALGTILSLDTSDALRVPGVAFVFTHLNRPDLAWFDKSWRDQDAPKGSPFRPLYDDKIVYSGQPVALVVAQSLEAANYAASLVKIHYAQADSCTDMMALHQDAVEPKNTNMGFAPPPGKRGDPDTALTAAPFRMDAQYIAPSEHHNPMECHASTVIVEDDGTLSIFDKNQGVFNCQQWLCSIFGLKAEQVRVQSPFVGGAFGSGLRPQYQLFLATMAARELKQSVRVSLTRQQMFTFGHRPFTWQKVQLACSADGRLQAAVHQAISHTSRIENYAEKVVHWTGSAYTCDNVFLEQKIVPLDIYTPLDMRAPGAVHGLFALESAMDELAHAAGIDPLDIRLINYAETDITENKPFSSKELRACYAQGADRFGWSRRTAEPRSMRDGERLVGWGMATGIWEASQNPASARATLGLDGRLTLASGTADIGTGTYTVMTQIAADSLGIGPEQITFKLGDTTLPNAPLEGGSWTVASVGSAVKQACEGLREQLAKLARKVKDSPLGSASPDELVFRDGRIQLKQDASRSVSFAEAMRAGDQLHLVNEVDCKPNMLKQKQYSMKTHSAVFVEVKVDEQLGTLEVSRVVSAVAAGRIVNPKTAANQVSGAVVWGISQALHEDSRLDHNLGRFMNHSFAEYHIPVQKDIHEIEVIFVPEEDDIVNPLGVKGVGEIGIVGVAAAVANAVFHATGKRIRDLPITLDKLL